MSDRVSQYILLCEDEAHSRLLHAYFRQCGISDRLIIDLVASRLAQGTVELSGIAGQQEKIALVDVDPIPLFTGGFLQNFGVQ